MKILVIAVGHRMPDWVKTAWDDYAKRLPSDSSVEIKEIKPEPRTQGKTAAQMMQAEAKRITSAIPEDFEWWALDELGKDITTIKLAEYMDKWRSGNQNVALLIGGPDGLDSSLKQSCQGMLRLSSLTLPHPMVRIVLVEQLYRTWSILNNHPYHRA